MRWGTWLICKLSESACQTCCLNDVCLMLLLIVQSISPLISVSATARVCCSPRETFHGGRRAERRNKNVLPRPHQGPEAKEGSRYQLWRKHHEKSFFMKVIAMTAIQRILFAVAALKQYTACCGWRQDQREWIITWTWNEVIPKCSKLALFITTSQHNVQYASLWTNPSNNPLLWPSHLIHSQPRHVFLKRQFGRQPFKRFQWVLDAWSVWPLFWPQPTWLGSRDLSNPEALIHVWYKLIIFNCVVGRI